MESKLEGAVSYFQFVDCPLDAAKQNDRIGHQSSNRRSSYILKLKINLYK